MNAKGFTMHARYHETGSGSKLEQEGPFIHLGGAVWVHRDHVVAVTPVSSQAQSLGACLVYLDIADGGGTSQEGAGPWTFRSEVSVEAMIRAIAGNGRSA